MTQEVFFRFTVPQRN